MVACAEAEEEGAVSHSLLQGNTPNPSKLETLQWAHLLKVLPSPGIAMSWG